MRYLRLAGSMLTGLCLSFIIALVAWYLYLNEAFLAAKAEFDA